MNLREVKAALIVKVALQVKKEMKNPRNATFIVRDLGMKDTEASRQRIIRACEELEERWG